MPTVWQGDAPGIGVTVEYLLQVFGYLVALLQQVGQFMLADGVAQARLGDVLDGRLVLLHLQGSLFHVPHRPVDHGVHVDGDGVFRQRLFGLERADPHALVDVGGNAVDDGHNHEGAGTLQPAELAHAQHYSPLPLVGNADGGCNQHRE